MLFCWTHNLSTGDLPGYSAHTSTWLDALALVHCGCELTLTGLVETNRLVEILIARLPGDH